MMNCLKIMRKRWRLMLVTFAAVTALSFGYHAVLTHVLHVEKAEIREMLSVPTQQIARVLRDRPEAVSEADS